jgi:hypothetical protein
MRISVYVIFILVILNCSALKSRDTLNVTVFETSQQFRLRDSLKGDFIAIGKLESENLIVVKKLLNKVTGKKIKDAKLVWALKYENKYYVNLGYCDDISMNSYFIKLEIVGNYCMSALTKKMLEPQSAGSTIGSSAGALGSLVGSYSDIVWGIKSQWKEPNSNIKCPILFIDLSEKEYRDYSRYRNESCRLKLLTKKDFQKIAKTKREHYKYTVLEIVNDVETVKEIVQKMNEN